MRFHYDQQSQFELFPGGKEESQPRSGSRFILANLTLTSDNLVILFVVVLMALVLSYSFGIERGKRAARSRAAQATMPILQATPATAKTPAAVNATTAAIAKPQALAATQPAVVIKANQAVLKTTPAVAVPAVAQPARSPVVVNSVPSLTQGLPSEKTIDKAYTVQVASFKDRTYAQKEAMDLRKKGYDAQVIPKGNHLIVCIGQFNDSEKANTALQKLKKRYKDSLVRRL